MGSFIVQNDFSHGELDRRLFSRTDLRVFRKCGEKMRNVIVTPQTGAKRRFGTKVIDDLQSLSGEYMMFDFESSDGFNYLLVLRETSLWIYFEDVRVATLIAPWTGQMLIDRTIGFSQDQDTVQFVNETFSPRQLVRVTHPGTWELVDKNDPAVGFDRYRFKNLPTFDFQDFNYDTLTFQLQNEDIGDDGWLRSSDPVFTTDHVGGRFISFGSLLSDTLGVAKILAFTSTTQVEVIVLESFKSPFNDIPGTEVLLEEPALSTTRGWPISVTFYEGRAWYGGSQSLPESLFGSRVNDFNDFALNTERADDGIFIRIATNRADRIEYLVSDRSFQIFTRTGEFSAPQATDIPLTPSTIAIRQQSEKGIERVEPVVIDNQTIFVKRGGKGVMSFIFNNDSSSYRSVENSTISGQLIRSPVDADGLTASTIEAGNFFFLINSDGTLAVYQTVIDEQISAWTLSDTVGLFKRVRVMGDSVYFIIERVIDGNTITSLEKLDFNLFTDMTIEQAHGAPTNVIAGLSELEGELVDIRGEVVDGQGFFVFPQDTVVGGQVTLPPGDEVVNSEVGLPYIPIIKPVPVNLVSEKGPVSYLPKNINRLFVDFYESAGIFVEGLQIPNRNFGDLLDQPPQLFSGIQEMTNTFGWARRISPTITQREPLPMTILGIGYEVSV